MQIPVALRRFLLPAASTSIVMRCRNSRKFYSHVQLAVVLCRVWDCGHLRVLAVAQLARSARSWRLGEGDVALPGR
jgi:hypothetical protein